MTCVRLSFMESSVDTLSPPGFANEGHLRGHTVIRGCEGRRAEISTRKRRREILRSAQNDDQLGDEAPKRALLRGLTNRNVVVEADAQIEVWTFKCRRKGLERASGADRGGRGHIERLFARRPINAEALTGETA